MRTRYFLKEGIRLAFPIKVNKARPKTYFQRSSLSLTKIKINATFKNLKK